MAFQDSAATVTVQAFLTAAGKKKLFDSIEGGDTKFITKFALGDSDANYKSIDSGFGVLESGHVPESSAFKPKIRGYVLQSGQFMPGVPTILVDSRHGKEHSYRLSLGANAETGLAIVLETEWPKNFKFSEFYDVKIQYPESMMTEDAVKRLLDVNVGDNNVLTVKYAADAAPADLQLIFGKTSGTNNSTTLTFRVEGKTTSAVTVIYVDLVE